MLKHENNEVPVKESKHVQESFLFRSCCASSSFVTDFISLITVFYTNWKKPPKKLKYHGWIIYSSLMLSLSLTHITQKSHKMEKAFSAHLCFKTFASEWRITGAVHTKCNHGQRQMDLFPGEFVEGQVTSLWRCFRVESWNHHVWEVAAVLFCSRKVTKETSGTALALMLRVLPLNSSVTPLYDCLSWVWNQLSLTGHQATSKNQGQQRKTSAAMKDELN